MLSDVDIRKYWKNGIEVYTPDNTDDAFCMDKQLQTGSIDLRFGSNYLKFKINRDHVLDYNEKEYTVPHVLSIGEKLRIEPGEMILATTLEFVKLTSEFAGIITGRSSIARLGIMVHCCQTFINPGHGKNHGQSVPLQLINIGKCAVELDPTIPICQIVFFRLETPASKAYVDGNDSKYSGEKAPIESQIHTEVRTSEHGVNQSSSCKKIKSSRVKEWLRKYVLPFIPGAITLFILTPTIYKFVQNNTIASVATLIKDAPLPYIFGIFLLVLFIYLKKGENK